MKNSTQLFSTVSLLVLLSTMPDNLWAMTNEGTEGDGTGKTTTAMKGPEDKKDTSKPTSGGWFSGWFGSSTPSEDVKKGGSIANPEVAQALVDTTRTLLEADPKDLEALREGGDLTEGQNELLNSTLGVQAEREIPTGEEQQTTPIKATEEEVQKVIQQTVASGTWGETFANGLWWATLPVSGPLTGLYHLGNWAVGGTTPAQPSVQASDDKTVVPNATASDPVVAVETPDDSLNKGEIDSTAPAKKKKKKKKDRTPEQEAEIRKAAELARQKAETEKLVAKASQEDLANREAILSRELSTLLAKLKEVRAQKTQAHHSAQNQKVNNGRHGKRK